MTDITDLHHKLALAEQTSEVARIEADKLSDQLQLVAKERDDALKDLLVLQAQAQALREALKDYYHGCQCNHGDIHAVNKRAYTALQMTENLP